MNRSGCFSKQLMRLLQPTIKQSWWFIVLKGEKKHKLGELVAESASRFSRPAQALLRMGTQHRQCSGRDRRCQQRLSDRTRYGVIKVEKEMAYDFFRTMEIQSSAAAVQNLLLAATSIGWQPFGSA